MTIFEVSTYDATCEGKNLDLWPALILYQITVQFQVFYRGMNLIQSLIFKFLFVFNPLLPVNFSGRHFLFDR